MSLFLRLGVLGMLSVCGWGARGQESQLRAPLAPLVATPAEDQLRVMAAQAGVIFAGEVLSVRAMHGLGLGTGWVEVSFRVEAAIRGCAGQGSYVLREWAGLWAGGSQRYRVGQRLLMLLHAPGASGMSSPVGGQDGAIPLLAGGVAGDETAVDLRWLETRVVRQPGSGKRLSGQAGTSTAVRVPGVRRHAQFEAGRLQGTGFGPAMVAVEESVTPTGERSASATLHRVVAMLSGEEALAAHAAR